MREGSGELERLLGRVAGGGRANTVELEELADARLADVVDAPERAGEVLVPLEVLGVDERARGEDLRMGRARVGRVAGLGEEAGVLVEDLEVFLKGDGV